MGVTHFQKLGGRIVTATSHPTGTEEKNGAMYYDTNDLCLYVYLSGVWKGVGPFTTSTSTSTTSSTSSSSSTSTTLTTSTSTSTSSTTTQTTSTSTTVSTSTSTSTTAT